MFTWAGREWQVSLSLSLSLSLFRSLQLLPSLQVLLHELHELSMEVSDSNSCTRILTSCMVVVVLSFFLSTSAK